MEVSAFHPRCDSVEDGMQMGQKLNAWPHCRNSLLSFGGQTVHQNE